MFFKGYWRVMSPEGEGTGGGGTAPDLSQAPPDSKPPEGQNTAPQSIWGDLKVAWPEGFDESLKEEKSLQSFVDKEGKFNYANVIKSFVSTKKALGANKVAIPGKNATEADWDEFHKQVFGWSTDINEYKLEKPKDSLIDDEFLKVFKEEAHKARLPVAAAQRMLAFIENTSKKEIEQETKVKQDYIQQGVDNMKKDWGEAYNRKIAYAQKFAQEVGGKPVLEFLKEKGLHNDPQMIRFMAEAGEKLYREGRVPKGGGNSDEPLTPEEIDREINDIRGDKNHPFNNPNHPNFSQAQKDVLKLYERKGRILNGQVF